MRDRTRRAVLLATVALLTVALVLGGRLAGAAIRVGVAHKARTLCSGVFVSGRQAGDVLAELQTDDLAILRHIPASIDFTNRSVTASLFGIVARRAVYRRGLGCALVLDGLVPPTLEDDRHSGAAPGRALQQDPAATTQGTGKGDLDAAVARAFLEPNPQRRRRTLAVVVTHRGRIVAEQYAPGIGPETPLAGWSMTKSVMNALAGILVRQGRLMLESPVPVPEWRHPGDARASITLDHLLRMSSGLRFDEGMANPRSDVMRMLFDVGDAGAFSAGMDLRAAPGRRWQYASGTTTLLARVIRQMLNDDTEYLTFPDRALFDPLGMSTAVMETDASGTFLASSYMYATARDWARFGMLYLDDGLANGERVLPEGWVAYTRSPAPADKTQRYGAHFWLEVPQEYAGTNPRLPVPAFHAAGHEAQFVTIVPSREAVIVRLGRTRYADAWDHPSFVRDVLAALERQRGRADARHASCWGSWMC